MRIPFDSVALAAIVQEIQPFVGGFVQEVRQPDEHSVTLHIYRRLEGEKGAEGMLMLSCHPQFARCHFVTRRPPNSSTPPVFCATLRARLQGSELTAAVQIARDRILRLTFVSGDGTHEIIGELMGKHSNLILIDERRRMVSACKWVPRVKSIRTILPNEEYQWPPVIRQQFLGSKPLETPRDWLRFRSENPEAVSKFFRDVEVQDATGTVWESSLSKELGAYPFRVLPVPISTLSVGLEQFFASELIAYATESLRSSLTGQLDRVLLAREVALQGLRQTLSAGESAGKWQIYGELILAYGGSLPESSKLLEAVDYEGNPVQIPLDSELDFKRNATRFFEKAKRAKGRVSILHDSAERLAQEHQEIAALRTRVQSASRLNELQEIQELARTRRWLITQVVAKTKEERPYQGHKIRELIGPGGIRVLYGDNAESNDYLTLRVAKPNDYWLHVRGSTSAHVVLQTLNHPEKIGKEHLMYAAKVAVQHSTSKHAGYVPVDYTLKKYVRKPRGAPIGTAIYTNEKTVHVES